jgi:hypothetical protein
MCLGEIEVSNAKAPRVGSRLAVAGELFWASSTSIIAPALEAAAPVWKSSLRYSRRASLQLLSVPRLNASCGRSLAWAEFLAIASA